MAEEAAEELQNALLAIHARLGTIEGKINLVARAEREQIIEVVREAISHRPVLGQIYLCLDGAKTQRQIHDQLTELGIEVSQPTVSRRMEDLVSEYGLADPVVTGGALILRKNRAAEDVLNLSRRVRKWLADDGHEVPTQTKMRSRPRKG